MPKLNKAGGIILAVGLFTLVFGIILFILTSSSISVWLIILSVIINAVGLTLLTNKET